ncbi:beta-1,4-N-acetylgalactosaminyltransferase bre-4 [Drosophila pseudoobscura]|uniref:Beta-1,4-N-acetylgalactosaminyltransferase bre-4 n=1 Tax=Drosophila pseudoobscura pseudoobscura TaxID=46245 RepID=A0A6I8UP57_DROPS|nr:beta-1,4-N-acetylgalactosaminyltransferase bre-4 [Drosophila pseudoobscura]
MFVRIPYRLHIYDLLKTIGIVTLIVYLALPFRFASHYDYIDGAHIEGALLPQVTLNVSLQQTFECSYTDIIANNRFVYSSAYYHETVHHAEEIWPGGEFRPEQCQARYSTAIIVPYRQREEQLRAFLTYMHNYLRQQLIHYRIFLVEQYDQKPFNRAMLLNIGAKVAAEYGFPCLILHDVDLMPLNSGQMYACVETPRHMCPALDHWRFHLPYQGLFGGVVAITTLQFKQINGMSNVYHGWGGEDDDLYVRIMDEGIGICRFAPEYSEYTMLKHKPENPNEHRRALLQAAKLRRFMDGLSSLVYKEVERRMHSLFTHILVET